MNDQVAAEVEEQPESQNIDAPVEESAQAESAPAPAGGFVETDNERITQRFGKLTAEKKAAIESREAERKARLKAEEELNALKGQPQPDALTLEKFDFDEDALRAAQVKQEVKDTLQQERQLEADTAKILTRQEREDTFVKQAAEYAKKDAAKGDDKTPSFEQAMGNLPQFSPETYNLILGVQDSPKLVHYLGANPQLANQIASLDVGTAGMYIGTIVSELSATGANTPQTSAAPDPINPINTGGGQTTDEWATLAQGVTFE